MREKILAADAIEAVIGLGPNLFYNSPMEACIVVCRVCAAECEHHAAHHDHCRVCAEVCRRCEQACRNLIACAGL